MDKLSICNIRIWNLIDKQRDMSLPDDERLKAADAVVRVNTQRAGLIDEIDQLLVTAVSLKTAPVDPKEKL